MGEDNGREERKKKIRTQSARGGPTLFLCANFFRLEKNFFFCFALLQGDKEAGSPAHHSSSVISFFAERNNRGLGRLGRVAVGVLSLTGLK
jgi:hypothetical protein